MREREHGRLVDHRAPLDLLHGSRCFTALFVGLFRRPVPPLEDA